MPMRVGVAMLSGLERLKVIFFRCGVLTQVAPRYIEVDIFARLGYNREMGVTRKICVGSFASLLDTWNSSICSYPVNM
jgi:hypothetical protein